jgi:hypothetical protein
MTLFIVVFCKKMHRVHTAGRESFKMLEWRRWGVWEREKLVQIGYIGYIISAAEVGVMLSVCSSSFVGDGLEWLVRVWLDGWPGWVDVCGRWWVWLPWPVRVASPLARRGEFLSRWRGMVSVVAGVGGWGRSLRWCRGVWSVVMVGG